MPIFKVSPSTNLNIKKLVSANNLEELKNRAEIKLNMNISTLKRKKDLIEIDDDEVLLELMQQEKELWLIAEEITNKDNDLKNITVYSLTKKEPIIIKADSLSSLYEQSENNLNIKIEKLVRTDGLDIDDDDDLFIELLKSNDNLSLVALQENEEFDESWFQTKNPLLKPEKQISILKNRKDPLFLKYQNSNNDVDGDDDDENQDRSNQVSELNDLMNLLKALKEKKTSQISEEKMKTNESLTSNKKESTLTIELIEKEKIEMENEEKKKKLSQLNKDILKSKEELDKENERLENEIKMKKNQYFETKEHSKMELSKKKETLLAIESKQKRIAGIFYDLKQAEKVDICFMVDCTGSMSSYIAETKIVIHQVCDNLKTKFDDFDLRMSFVGYRDHSDGFKRVVVFPFTNQVLEFKRFVSSVEATGGADECEDIFGGLEEVGRLDWSNKSRVLVHIGDAPCHGERFHTGANDSYPGGDPRKLDISDLLQKIISLNISYYFGEINKSTLKMIEEFDKVFIKNQGNKISVFKLASASCLTEMVTKSVITTIMTSKSASIHLSRSKKLKTLIIDPEIKWNIKEMFKHSAKFNKVTFDGTLSELKTKELENEKFTDNFWIAKSPFSKGAMRYAYIATNQESPLNKFIAKESLSNDEEFNTEKYYKELIENHVISSYLANLFSQEIKKIGIHKLKVRYVDIKYLHVKDTGRYYTFEDYLDGEFQKWISNGGVFDEENYSCILDAFAHWTYQSTNEYLIVLDLQGVFKKNEFILTDPAIICPEDLFRFGPTNLGIKGVKKYFETHRCNHICNRLNLIKHKYQSKADRESDSCV